MSDKSAASQISAKGMASGVLVKLLVFSVMLGVVPIGSYFGTLNRVWHGNTTLAAITAVVSANVVLLAYIILSIIDDSRTPTPVGESTEENRKEK